MGEPTNPFNQFMGSGGSSGLINPNQYAPIMGRYGQGQDMSNLLMPTMYGSAQANRGFSGETPYVPLDAYGVGGGTGKEGGYLSNFLNSETGRNIFGYKDAGGASFGGLATPALGLAQGLASGYMGYKSLQAYGQQQAQRKKEFDLNYGAHVDTINTRMRGLADVRAGGSSTAESADSYMARNGLKKA